MASQVKLIADAMVTLITGVTGVPSTIEWRKTDVVHPKREDGTGDPDDMVIVTHQGLDSGARTFGDCVFYEYLWRVSVYGRTTGDVDGTDTRPTLAENIRKALSVETLSGTSVFDYEVSPGVTWQASNFRDGQEVSWFEVLYRTSEAVN